MIFVLKTHPLVEFAFQYEDGIVSEVLDDIVAFCEEEVWHFRFFHRLLANSFTAFQCHEVIGVNDIPECVPDNIMHDDNEVTSSMSCDKFDTSGLRYLSRRKIPTKNTVMRFDY